MYSTRHIFQAVRIKRLPRNGFVKWNSNIAPKHVESEWQPVIGLEFHAQISAASKLFSGSDTSYGGLVNDQVSFFDAALPGTLPVLNRRCVEAGLKTAMALNCHINMVSYFDRKHYFYADLPAGYQITQQRKPIAHSGSLSYVVNNTTKTAGIWQIQLEQDSGKSLHDAQGGISLIDLNRAGVGLMEIVTAPDFESSSDVTEFIKELQLILKVLGTCDCKMDEGSLRVDASVSLHRPGEDLGTRCEVKNLNSIRFVKKAIDYEIQRQRKTLQDGGKVENETRSFDLDTGKTVAMRDKEKVHDYRFMPEPNLLPLRLKDSSSCAVDGRDDRIDVDAVRASMPVLPQVRRDQLVREYSLTPEQAVLIVNEPGLWEVFLELFRDDPSRDVQLVTWTLTRDLFGALNATQKSLQQSEITTSQIGAIIDLLAQSQITRPIARKLFTECLTSGNVDVVQTVKSRGWTAINDTAAILDLCQTVITENKHVALKAQKGKKKYLQRLQYRVQEMSNDCANPDLVLTLLQEQLKNLKS